MSLVSVIIPCYNEESTIRLLLEALYGQTYPHSQMEVIVADGLSTDRSRQVISAFQRDHPDLAVKVVENPERIIPAALNCAIQAACGEYIVRLDAHSIPYPDYVQRCVSALEAGTGDNVGGVWEIRPAGAGWQSRSIAAAAAHPLGVGDARYRLGGPAQAVDTVPFGAFRRSIIEKIGPFDEKLLTNEDYEFNVRVRQSGGRVWLDPGIRARYFARPTFSSLARQYGRYGYWKARMLKRYPHTLRWRQLLPPLFILSLLVLLLLSAVYRPAFWLVVVELSLYTLALFLAGMGAVFKNKDAALILGLPLAIATMHIAWGSAFLWSAFGLATSANKNENTR